MYNLSLALPYNTDCKFHIRFESNKKQSGQKVKINVRAWDTIESEID
jgi:hypothetical protein